MGPDVCHPWTGRTVQKKDGPRGVYDHDNTHNYAHRIAWFLTHGTWPTPQANHTCDNSICCNVRHLYEGTQQDNIRDREERARRVAPRGEQHSNSLFTDAQVQAIKELNAAGWTAPAIARELETIHVSTIYNILKRTP